MELSYINNPAFREQNEDLKSIYNKWQKRLFGKRLPVHVFGSGSEGNSVYLKPYHILIDLGLPFKRYQEYDPQFFLDVDYIILTHHHGDHLNPSTLTRILKKYPHITIIISEFMWDIISDARFKAEFIKRDPDELIPFGHDIVYKTDTDGNRLTKPPKYQADLLAHRSKFRLAEPQTLSTHSGRSVLFEPLTVKHGNIVNIAIQLNDPSLDFDFLYASDLDNLDGARSFIDWRGGTQHVTGLNQTRQYTCMFLEANYDEDILNQWYNSLSPDDPGYRGKKARADGNLRHISEQAALKYIQNHLVDNGIFVPLHASRTFGTLHQS